MVQNRRIDSADTVIPSCGMSRSRNVLTKSFRQRMLAASDRAR
jgi:hypothetical protein